MKILYWTQNEAAQNIMKHFNELGVDAPVFETEKNFLYLENEDITGEADFLIVPSTHKSAADKRSLTIHATGNFGSADYGGGPRKLNPTNPAAIAVGLRSMAAAGLEGFDVCLEVTHHGPTLDTPLIFIEIGSTEEQWKNQEAGKVVANAIKDIFENQKEFTNYIGFGGPHYAPGFTKLILENPNIAIGHILPKYQQENVTKEIIQQMIDGSNAKKAVIDWDGLRGDARKQVTDILDELGVEWCKTGELRQNIKQS